MLFSPNRSFSTRGFSCACTRGTKTRQVTIRHTVKAFFITPPSEPFETTGIIKRLSKSEDGLKHRRPAGHSRGVRSKGSAIWGFVYPHQLAGHPQTLGRQEIPLETTAVLIRVGGGFKWYFHLKPPPYS